MEIIAKRIKSLREEHGLTQDQLVKALNISRNAISNYENGVRTPDLNVIRDICEFFNVTLDSFFKEELVYKKAPKTKEIKTILQIILIILLIATSILSIVLFDKSFSRTRAVDDVTKVENSKEISIIKISNKIDKKTYEVEIIDNLKGDGFSFIVIKDNDIEVNISSNYLVFGNRVSKNSQYKNYVSFDVIEIYSPQYIQELSGDALTHPTVNYYKELIEDEPKEDVGHLTEQGLGEHQCDDENDDVGDIKAAIQSYVTEMTSAFLSGEKDIDKEWNSYIKELENIGYKDYLEVLQTAYDRVH